MSAQPLRRIPERLDGVEPEAPPPAPAAREARRPLVMIDGFNLALEKGTGVATYARNLSLALRDMGCDVSVLYGNSLSAAAPALLKEVMFFDPQHSHLARWRRALRRVAGALMLNRINAFEVPITGAVIRDPFASRLPHYDSIWNATDLYEKAATQFEWAGLVNRVRVPRKPDLVHWTYPLPVRVPGVPNIYTLHDLVPLRLPYTTLDRKRSYLKLMRWIGKTASHIVTVSESSKRDIVELLGVDEDKVTNTYQAVTIPARYRDKPDEAVRQEIEGTFGLKYQKYYLFFGSLEPKKNIGRMIEGFLASGVDAPLVIVGAQAWKSERELALLGAEDVRAQLSPRVRGRKIVRLEYAPFALLTSLIRGARGVLFPSLYEGFGLPILESMMLGTPVLSSNTSSIPEIAGTAAVLVDPYDGHAIAEGIRAIDSDAALRMDMIARGFDQAERFSAEAYQRRLDGVYARFLR